MGGAWWGGTDDTVSIRSIHRAIERRELHTFPSFCFPLAASPVAANIVDV